MEYGSKVKYRLTGEIGTVIGFMHRDHDRKLLVKFDMDHEIMDKRDRSGQGGQQ